MKPHVGLLHEQRLRMNLENELWAWMRLVAAGATERELDNQRGIVRGCAIQLLAYCNPLYNGSRVALEQVERTVARDLIQRRGMPQPERTASVP